tara:strand:- start:101 stop:310 length:210 start_codon:yes stop_codon:yes gene_type:complete
MRNNFLHNNKFINNKNASTQNGKNFNKKVDINILLNRVKLNESNKRKNTIIFITTVLLSLFLFAYILIA